MIEVIPAIDLLNGRCVRLRGGDFNARSDYAADPLTMAQRFEGAGLRRLHLVDLDGARSGSPQNLPMLELIARSTSLVVDFSGGIRRREDLEAVFSAGGAQAAAGSVAVKTPQIFLEWLTDFGADRLILAADCKNGLVAASGWVELSDQGVAEFLQPFSAAGLRRVLCTEISRDGMLAGPAFDLYTQLRARYPNLQFIASGGVTTVSDIRKLDGLGLHGVIIGKALYEGRITLEELEIFSC